MIPSWLVLIFGQLFWHSRLQLCYPRHKSNPFLTHQSEQYIDPFSTRHTLCSSPISKGSSTTLIIFKNLHNSKKYFTNYKHSISLARSTAFVSIPFSFSCIYSFPQMSVAVEEEGTSVGLWLSLWTVSRMFWRFSTEAELNREPQWFTISCTQESICSAGATKPVDRCLKFCSQPVARTSCGHVSWRPDMELSLVQWIFSSDH